MSSGYGATMSGNIKEVAVDEDFEGDFDSVTHTLHGQVIGAAPIKARGKRPRRLGASRIPKKTQIASAIRQNFRNVG